MSQGACFYRGTSTDQVTHFKDTDKKLVEQMEKKKQFPAHFSESVDMKKVSLDVIKPWIRKRICELMGLEDDIVIEYCIQQLSEELPPGKKLDPKTLQLNLTPFMERKAKLFCNELWTHLLSAQQSPVGVPQSFIDLKKQELQEKKDKAEALQQELDRRRAEMRTGTSAGSFSSGIPAQARFPPPSAPVSTSTIEHQEETNRKRPRSTEEEGDASDDAQEQATAPQPKARRSRFDVAPEDCT